MSILLTACLIDNAETAFTFLFALEIFIRILGAPSWTQFWYSGRNKFDLFLVIVTCVIQLPMIQDSESYKYLTIFQCLRSYRLFIGIPRVRRLLVSRVWFAFLPFMLTFQCYTVSCVRKWWRCHLCRDFPTFAYGVILTHLYAIIWWRLWFHWSWWDWIAMWHILAVVSDTDNGKLISDFPIVYHLTNTIILILDLYKWNLDSE